jgi:hypothetical protein
MAISYVSQVAKSNPYVLPFDLNLMARVLQYKETNFIQNANKIQQGVNALSSLEMKDANGQQYLNSKINSLVSKMNNYGDMDLSDMSVSNQLDHMVNSLPQDETIMTQVSGMKLGRKMMSEYEKMRTDPKMKGTYSDANYNWSMDQFNKWRMDNNAGSSYNGPTTATPFFDVNKFYHDNLKQVRGQIAQTITRPDGTNMYYMKNSTKLIDEGELKQIVNDLTFSDPRAGGQAQINSWYSAKNKTPEMIVGSLNESIDYELTSTGNTIQYLKDQIELIGDKNSELTNSYTGQIKNLEAYNKSLKERKSGYTLEAYNQNPDQFNFLDYQTRTARAFGNIYKLNEQTKDLKLDNTWYLKERLRLQDDANEIAAAKNGLTKINGKWTLINSNGQIDPSTIFAKSNTYDTDWTTDPEAMKYAEGMIKDNIAALNTEEAETAAAILQQSMKENPNMVGVWTKELQDELTRRGQLVNPNDTQFDFDDLKYALDVIKEGKLGNFVKLTDQRPYPQRVPDKTETPGIDPLTRLPKKNTDNKSVEYAATVIEKFYNAWKNGAIESSPSDNVDFKGLGLTDAFNRIQILRRKKNIQENMLKESFNRSGLSEDEQNTYMDYLNNPTSYQTQTSKNYGGGGMGATPAIVYEDNSVIKSIKSKLNNSTYFDDISKRFQPVGWVMFDEKSLGEKELGGKKVITSFKRQISDYVGRGYFADKSEGENIFKFGNKNGITVKDEEISDVTIYKMPDGVPDAQGVIPGVNTRYYASAVLTTKDGDKTIQKSIRVPIDTKALHSELGTIFELPMDQQLTNDEVSKFGSTDLIYDAGVNNMRVQFRVVSAGDDGISAYPKAKVQLVVTDPNSRTGKKYISVFGNQIFNTPAEAEREGRKIVDYYIKTNSGKKSTLDELAYRLQNNL